jgi:hypothetical protein
VQSRTGALDIFVVLVVLVPSSSCRSTMIEDRTPTPPTEDDVGDEAPSKRKPRLPSPLWRPYRFAAGAAGGAAMATKWAGLTAFVTAIVLGFLWEVMRRKRFGVRSPVTTAITTEGSASCWRW